MANITKLYPVVREGDTDPRVAVRRIMADKVARRLFQGFEYQTHEVLEAHFVNDNRMVDVTWTPMTLTESGLGSMPPVEDADPNEHAAMDHFAGLTGRASMVAKAHALAKEWHQKDKRKVTGHPYIVHPQRVAAMLADSGASEAVVAAAYLHDVIEDATGGNDVDKEQERDRRGAEIKKEFPAEVYNLVMAMSRDKKTQTKEQYLTGLKSKGKGVALIKMADRLDNLRDGARTMGKDWIKKYLISTSQVLEVGRAAGLGENPIYKLLQALFTKLKSEVEPVQHEPVDRAFDPTPDETPEPSDQRMADTETITPSVKSPTP